MRVVVGFDATPRSWAALREAEQEATSRGEGIELLAVPGAGTPVVPARRDGTPRRSTGPGAGRSRTPRVTTTIDGARRMVARRRPGLEVTATVLLTDELDRLQPLSGASLLVLGWMRGAADLADGLGPVGTRLATHATIPVLVVPVGVLEPRTGPVVVLPGASTSPRAAEVALGEARLRDVPVVEAPADALDDPHRGVPALVVSPVGEGLSPLDHGAGADSDVSCLLREAVAPVLLVPPEVPAPPVPQDLPRVTGRPG